MVLRTRAIGLTTCEKVMELKRQKMGLGTMGTGSEIKEKVLESKRTAMGASTKDTGLITFLMAREHLSLVVTSIQVNGWKGRNMDRASKCGRSKQILNSKGTKENLLVVAEKVSVS